MRKILTLVLAAGLFAALPPTHSRDSRADREAAGPRGPVETVRANRSPLLSPKQDGCVEHTIACGETVGSDITTNDCKYPETDIFYDFWFFQGIAGQTVTLTMSSNDFDPFLQLYDPDFQVVEDDDNSGPGDAARIVYLIDQSSPDWSLDATPGPGAAFVTGEYTLSLQCSNPCPEGFFADPEYPDFCFDVTITPAGQGPIDGAREPECIEDTVCVSGALAGRSEVYVRILGPRPNGFLWPTIVRFTPSAVTVDIHQRSSGDTQTYELEAVPPGNDDLSGLQDRTGFQP